MNNKLYNEFLRKKDVDISQPMDAEVAKSLFKFN